ncbi:hypothetical protein [Rhodococcus sp. MEB064]|uniref:hypothetical protein n=1 Tax=Rhodococcus sp. MEB064 TaxID=1587522 RepID=UPI0005ACA2C1|nr:hypothetical protein [Rhodococcus sp. MEB064]KIQ15979.1 hypothetical protein RU01_15000 [Rhodococcus sp. MEB064]
MSALAVLLSSFLAAVLLSQSGGLDITGDSSGVGVLLASGGGVLAAAVIAGSLVAMFARGRVVVATLVAMSAATAGLSAVLLAQSSYEYVAVVAGSILLGCAAVLSVSLSGVRWQPMFVAGFLVGLLTAGAWDALETDVPERYTDYLTEAERSTPVIVPVLAALTVLIVVGSCRRPFAAVPPAERSGRLLLAVLMIPLCGLLTHWLFLRQLYDSSGGTNGIYYFGILAVPVLLVAAALMPGRTGAPVLAGTAVLAATSTSSGIGLDVGSPAWTYGFILGSVIAVAVGVGLGVRWKRPITGIAVLAVVCVTALLDRPPLDNIAFAASLAVLPAAAAYVFTAITPTMASSSTVGLAVPVAITVPMIVTYGWTAYTPLTEVDTATFSPTADLWVSTGVAVGSVILAGIGLGLVLRRPT